MAERLFKRRGLHHTSGEQRLKGEADQLNRQVESAKQEIEKSIRGVLNWIGGLSLFALAVVLVVSLVFTRRSITRPITRIVSGLNEGTGGYDPFGGGRLQGFLIDRIRWDSAPGTRRPALPCGAPRFWTALELPLCRGRGRVIKSDSISASFGSCRRSRSSPYAAQTHGVCGRQIAAALA